MLWCITSSRPIGTNPRKFCNSLCYYHNNIFQWCYCYMEHRNRVSSFQHSGFQPTSIANLWTRQCNFAHHGCQWGRLHKCRLSIHQRILTILMLNLYYCMLLPARPARLSGLALFSYSITFDVFNEQHRWFFVSQPKDSILYQEAAIMFFLLKLKYFCNLHFSKKFAASRQIV